MIWLSRTAAAVIVRVYGLPGKVLSAVCVRESYAKEDWLVVVVTSDHRGKGTGHSRGHETPEILNSFLIVSGPSSRLRQSRILGTLPFRLTR